VEVRATERKKASDFDAELLDLFDLCPRRPQPPRVPRSCTALLAVRVADLGAAGPFYAGQSPIEDVPKIKAPLPLHYAGNDERVNAGWPACEAALKANGVRYVA
jgi:hypothetical protein